MSTQISENMFIFKMTTNNSFCLGLNIIEKKIHCDSVLLLKLKCMFLSEIFSFYLLNSLLPTDLYK